MSHYRVFYKSGSSAHIDVDANDKEHAQEVADNLFSSPGLCHKCGQGVEIGDEWEVDEVIDIEEET